MKNLTIHYLLSLYIGDILIKKPDSSTNYYKILKTLITQFLFSSWRITTILTGLRTLIGMIDLNLYVYNARHEFPVVRLCHVPSWFLIDGRLTQNMIGNKKAQHYQTTGRNWERILSYVTPDRVYCFVQVKWREWAWSFYSKLLLMIISVL